MLKINLITRTYGGEINGLSRYDRALYEGLSARRDVSVVVRPLQAPRNRIFDRVQHITGLDITTFLGVHPLWLPRIEDDLGHFTTSSHATALVWKPRIPIVITVHDIVHYTYRNNQRLSTYRHIIQRLASTLAIRNLRHATAIIASSAFTKQQLIRHAGLQPERIYVVPLGIDRNRFRPCEVPAAFYEKYGLNPRRPYVLHVSSEEPRKNIETLLRAWVQVQRQRPDAVLLKVGRCLYPEERRRLLRLVDRLGIGESVRFVESVPDADLPLFYNAARVFAFPSLAEGFGLPVLEAMACGTPVVCSNIAALLEIAGDATLLVEPADAESMADAICALLENESLGVRLHDVGLEQSAAFSWARTVQETVNVYALVSEAKRA